MINSVIDSTRFDTDVSSYIYEMEEFYCDIYSDYVLCESAYIHNDMNALLEARIGFFQRLAQWFQQLKDKFTRATREVNAKVVANNNELEKVKKEYHSTNNHMGIDFTVKGFDYTTGKKISFGPIDDANKAYEEVLKLLKVKNVEDNGLNPTKMKEKTDEIISKYKDDSFINQSRAKIIGHSSPINSTDEFKTIVRSTYRGGTDKTKDIHVNRSFVETIIRDSSNINRMKNDAIKDEDYINKQLNRYIQFYKNNMPEFNVDPKTGKEVGVGTWSLAPRPPRPVQESVSLISDANKLKPEDRAELQRASNRVAESAKKGGKSDEYIRNRLNQFQKEWIERELNHYDNMNALDELKNKKIPEMRKKWADDDAKFIQAVKQDIADMKKELKREAEDPEYQKGLDELHKYVVRKKLYDNHTEQELAQATHANIVRAMNAISTYLQTLSICYTTAAAERVNALNEQCRFYTTIIRTANKQSKGDE